MGLRRAWMIVVLVLMQAVWAMPAGLEASAQPDPVCSVEPRSPDELLSLWFDDRDTPVPATPSSLRAVAAQDLPDGTPADSSAVAEVEALAGQWIACRNAGDQLRIYALFTDAYTQRNSLRGLGPEEARQRLDADPAPLAPEVAWTIELAREPRTLPDGRVGAGFVIEGGGQQLGSAINVFVVIAEQDGRWRIDDIVTLVALDPVAPVWGYRVVADYPHDPEAYTQGLVIENGVLFEGTGLNGRSSLRRVDLSTGEVLQSRNLDEKHFGEGVVVLGDRIFQLTWRTGTCFVYDRETFELLDTFGYTTEGWGLTTDGERLIMSDGTSRIVFRDPETFAELGAIDVRDGGAPVSYLNELEYIDGEIWANVYQTDWIVRIDPASGAVIGWIDLTDLLTMDDRPDEGAEVLNGIAYDADTGSLYVTGKLWPTLFEIEPVPPE